MKILYFGGQKSGKSLIAEKKAIELSKNKKPYYIATYDNSYNDTEMNLKISNHKNQRKNNFITIEELHSLDNPITSNNTYLIDCVSMWIMNNMQKNKFFFIDQLDKISNIDSNIIFVLNDVNNGIIAQDKQTRKFVEFTGIIGAKLTSICNEVYEVKYTLKKRLK
jgi:adenosylcobinamide kinase/adenosylcobinamide-phosphate guanylyltransferase